MMYIAVVYIQNLYMVQDRQAVRCDDHYQLLDAKLVPVKN